MLIPLIARFIPSTPLPAAHANDPAESQAAAAPAASPVHDSSPPRTPVAGGDTRAQASRGRFNFLAIQRRDPSKPRVKVKGFSRAESEQLATCSEDEQQFVTTHHTALKALGYKPLDMLTLAMQLPQRREFVLRFGHRLMNFTPTEMNGCASLPVEQRNFMEAHMRLMQSARLQPREMFRLASAPADHHRFFVWHWHTLVTMPLTVQHMEMCARMPPNTRELLMANSNNLQGRQFAGDDWATITSFNEHQCYRLIREGTRYNLATNAELLNDISGDGADYTPKNLDWLDRASHHSIGKWSSYAHISTSVALSKMSKFCSDAMPGAFLQRLREVPAAQPLGTLVGGLVFTAGHAKDQGLTTERAKAVIGYLQSKDDPKLWQDCQVEAKDAVEQCGDRVDYGFSRVAQVIELHKMTSGEFSPAMVVDSVLAHFNRDQVEVAAQRIAVEKNTESESVEVFLSLATQLAKRGVNVGELHNEGLYSNWNIFKVDPARVAQVKTQLEAHCQERSVEFRAAVEDNLTVQNALRKLYPEDFQTMLDQREEAQDIASDVLLSPASDDPQDTEHRRAAREELEGLGTREPEWYARKIQEVLATGVPASRAQA